MICFATMPIFYLLVIYLVDIPLITCHNTEFQTHSTQHEQACLEGECNDNHRFTETQTDTYYTGQEDAQFKDSFNNLEQAKSSINNDGVISNENVHIGYMNSEAVSVNRIDSEKTASEDSEVISTAADFEVIQDKDNTIIREAAPEFAELESENGGTVKDEKNENSPTLSAVVPVKNDEEENDSTDSHKENIEQQLDHTPPRRRLFPLLYTLRTLFNSLLSEFGDDGGNQEGTFNSSDVSSVNLTSSEELVKDLNATGNGTEAGKKTRFLCATKNITFGTKGKVKIVNSTELLEMLNSSKNQKVSTCVLVMFYAPWCHFCARTAPHYNALARAYPQLDVLAVDTSHFSYLNARFGTVAVPNVMLFHARSAVRFNHTAQVLNNLIQFVVNNTGIDPDKNVKLQPTDFVGPLPSVVVRGRDWLLWLAWAFIILCSTFGFVRSRYGQSFITRVRVLWQEHQHIE